MVDLERRWARKALYTDFTTDVILADFLSQNTMGFALEDLNVIVLLYGDSDVTKLLAGYDWHVLKQK